MRHIDPERWGEYNALQAARPVRPLARVAADLAGPARGRTAVELGSGAGREAAFLADLGWQVHTYDADPTVADNMAALISKGVHHTRAALEDVTELPLCDLLLSCASLQFVKRSAFDAVWAACRGALRPGGVLALDLLGDRDQWADGEGTFLARRDLDELLAGLDTISVEERETDARAFAGPKRWHAYDVIARTPQSP